MSVVASEAAILLRADEDRVCTLTLNRPRYRNALSTSLMSALTGQLDDIAGDADVKVVVIAGTGVAFCAGHDLRELRNKSEAHYREIFGQCSAMMQRIVGLPQPVIAEVNGFAFAAGCQLVASCDLAIASDTARFSTPGVNIGLFCSTPMVALSRNVGRKAAMEMLLLGESIDAERARSIGLVNRHVPPEGLRAATMEWARAIVSKASSTVRIGKRAFYEQLEHGLTEAYDYASEIMTRNMLEQDASEGIDAFLEQREPRWIK